MSICKSIHRVILLFIFFYSAAADASAGRWEQCLSGEEWSLWLDREATWIDDELFLPPAELARLPVNPPTCGWESLHTNGIRVNVPGTVEEHYWGANGNHNWIAADYRGVSWWSREFTLDKALEGKRVVLAFESVNLRAEVYLNGKLAGYDIIGNIPFDIDVTDAVLFGSVNRLDIRITDPGGNFSWEAHNVFRWGRYLIPIVRGFGGITGDVFIRALDPVSVSDVYVLNKPAAKEVDLFVEIENSTGKAARGRLLVEIRDWKESSEIIWRRSINANIPAEGGQFSFNVRAPKAKIWDILQPNLYIARVTFETGEGNSLDSMERRFGFRWFEMKEKDNDMRLYLNGRRIFLIGAKNRQYFPSNGMYASPEIVQRDIEATIQLGFNMIKFTNAINQPNHIKAADEAGLLTTFGAAGYRINDERGVTVKDEFAKALRREKLLRHIRRDRSHPSFIFHELKSEDRNLPDEDDFRNIAEVRKLDPSRLFIYLGDAENRRSTDSDDDPMKLFWKPYDEKGYTFGWWDRHNWIRFAGWVDVLYRNPRNYYRFNASDGDSTVHVNPSEIIYYGEEGAFGTVVRLQKIKEEIEKKGQPTGWREGELLEWFRYYDSFLDASGFRGSFRDVDELTLALGRNMHYFHGRMLENTRISNIIDGYIVNGMAAGNTRTDFWDIYRNITADPEIFRHYTQPLYMAVKVRDKVLPAGSEPVADIYIINEKNLRGNHVLELKLTGPSGEIVHSSEHKVSIRGGENYGQLLIEEIKFPSLEKNGHYKLNASIKGQNCEGYDEIYVVDLSPAGRTPLSVAVIDTGGTVEKFLNKNRSIQTTDFDAEKTYYDCIIFGRHDPDRSRRLYTSAIENAYNGATVIFLDSAERMAQTLDGMGALTYMGSSQWAQRGRFFVGGSPMLKGLPDAQAMGWEYQVFYHERGDVMGMNLDFFGHDIVAVLGAAHRKDILTAATSIPFGNGRIILSTLRILPELDSVQPQSVVAKRLFLNFVETGQ